MLIKLLIIALLLLIIFNLVRAGIMMLRNDQPTARMSQFLGKRIIYSVLVLLIILLAIASGLISPNPRPY